MPNARFSLGMLTTRFIDVNYNNIQGKYEIALQAQPFYQNGQTVQYLPWASNTGAYICLHNTPSVFFTDKLTGCFLAFDAREHTPTICHLNFMDYNDQEKDETIKTFSQWHVLIPEDYLGDTTVFGVFNEVGRWEFFYQVQGHRYGTLLMSDRQNRYGTKSVTLGHI